MSITFTASVSTVNNGNPTSVTENEGLTVGEYFDNTLGRVNGDSRAAFLPLVSGQVRSWDYEIQSGDRVQFGPSGQKNA